MGPAFIRIAAAVAAVVLSSRPLAAQAPALAAPAQTPAPLPANSATTTKSSAPAPPPEIKDATIGFSYSLPADWETQALQPSTPDVPYPAIEAPKKGNACAEVELTARHGTPFSVVVVVGLPFDCYGQTLTDQNMADFTAGAAEGLKETFEVTNPSLSSYKLGSHSMWMERASGTVKGQPESKYTLEVACALLKKGAACWMAMAADASDVQIFEQGRVTLEGDAFDALVPAGAVPAQTSGK